MVISRPRTNQSSRHEPLCKLIRSDSLQCNERTGTFSEELARYFVGGGIELPDWNAVSGGGSDRLHPRTTPAGVVHLEVGVIFRDFRQFGVEY